MKLSHKLKLIIPRFRWLLNRREGWKTFRSKRDLFDNLTNQAKELEIEYNRLVRLQPNVNASQDTPLAQMHYARGKLDTVKDILNDR